MFGISLRLDQANYTINLGNVVNPNNPGYGDVLYRIELFSGNCSELQRIIGHYVLYPSKVYLTNLIIGGDYYFRIYSGDSSYDVNFSFCISEDPIAQNDECANAIAVTPVELQSCEYPGTVYNFEGATQSMPSCSGTTYANDIWYKFIATSSSQLIDISAIYGNKIDVELFGGACNALTSIRCISNEMQTNPVFQGLTIGETYYLRFAVGQFIQGSFTFCVETLPSPPVNDDCVSGTFTNKYRYELCRTINSYDGWGNRKQYSCLFSWRCT